MKTLHTPGPWGVQKESGRPFKVITKNEKSSKYWIAELVSENQHFESKRDESNAFLISAAPCLLEVSQMTLDYLAGCSKMTASELSNLINRAIAKSQRSGL